MRMKCYWCRAGSTICTHVGNDSKKGQKVNCGTRDISFVTWQPSRARAQISYAVAVQIDWPRPLLRPVRTERLENHFTKIQKMQGGSKNGSNALLVVVGAY